MQGRVLCMRLLQEYKNELIYKTPSSKKQDL